MSYEIKQFVKYIKNLHESQCRIGYLCLLYNALKHYFTRLIYQLLCFSELYINKR